MKDIKGSIVALVTPFLENGDIDYCSLEMLIEFHILSATNAILVNGTTAESPCITLEEFDSLTKFIVDKVNNVIPVIAGTGSNNTEDAIVKSQIAEKNGVDALLVVTPYYNKATRKGLKMYFTAIAEATELPIIMYNVPGRTGVNMELDLIFELANENHNITGIKEASGDMDRIMGIIHIRPVGFKVFSGDDNLALSTVMMGGNGCISVIANQIPKVFSQMMRAAENGEFEIARSLHYKYYNLMRLNFIETNPIPVKTALAHMGLIKLNFRSPLCTMEEATNDILLCELRKLDLVNSKKERELAYL